MLPWDSTIRSRVDELELDSVVLRDNPLGDPHVRPVWVQVPPDHDDIDADRYPVVYVLLGYGGLVPTVRSRQPYGESQVELVDALMSEQGLPRFIAVYLDCWTAYGCGQYVDSPGTGAYHTFLCDEVVPFVDARYKTLADREHRAITGKSSGGFGAMITSMLRPDLFSVLATHAGDALYETNYLREFGNAARALQEYGGDIMAFWKDFTSRRPFTKRSDQLLWLLLGISSSYSAEPDGTVVLPFDPATGRLRDDVWKRWLDWDPVRMLERPECADAMRTMKGIWVDAGTGDDYNLDLGARAFRDGLLTAGVAEDRIHFELVNANHWTISQQYGPALRWVAQRLVPVAETRE